MMASNNYYSFTPAVAAQLGAISAYASPGQTVVQPTHATFLTTAPRLPMYSAYPSVQQSSTQQYALHTQGTSGNVVDYFASPILQAAPSYESAAKAYYAPVAPAPTGATIYTLPVDATAVYQAAPKSFYPVAAPVAAPAASQTTMYTVSAEPMYQTLAVGAKPVFVANTYQANAPARQLPTAIRLIQAPAQQVGAPTAISIASYAYQPVQAPSVLYSNASVLSVGSPITTTTTTAVVTGHNFAIYTPGVDQIYTSIASSGSYVKFAPSSAASTAVLSTTSSSPSYAVATSTPKVGAWHNRLPQSRAESVPVKHGTASASSLWSSSMLPQSSAQQTFFCRVCMVDCVGAQTYKEHIEGQRHKKKEAATKSPQVPQATPTMTRSSIVQMHCQLCDVACSGADTYTAHIRGLKHQKVLKHHSSLGRQTSSACRTSTVVANSAARSATEKKDNDSTGDDNDGLTYGDGDVQPIGHEYIEEARNESGIAVGFYCKLCECKFTDPNAKLMHMKGRRHRLQFKKKVDPNLQVDFKSGYGRRAKEERVAKQQEEMRRRYIEDKWRMECEQLRYEEGTAAWNRNPGFPLAPQLPFGLHTVPTRRPDNLSDRMVMARHSAIYPNEQELDCVQSTVTTVELALQRVADSFTDSAKTGDGSSASSSDGEKKRSGESADGRVLRSFVRVGSLAKGLLLHGNLHVHLVALCSEKPTRTLLDTMFDRLTKQLQIIACDAYEVKLCVEEAGLIVERVAMPIVTCRVTLTSPIVRDPTLAAAPELGVVIASVSKIDPPDVLDRQKCLAALAEQRRTKWFQARVSGVQSCLIILRLMRDICQRIPAWRVISDWMLELLIEKCICSFGGLEGLSPGNALRRVFECVASGVLLTGGPGLLDPCEKDATDVIDQLTNQEREEVTASSQLAVRLMSFRQIHRLLGMEAIQASSGFTQKDRKRPSSEILAGETNEKRDKLK